jgi:hypothetical protein
VIVVHEPERTTRGHATRVTARADIPGFGTQSLWFEADDETGSFLTARADAFAAALLPIAAALGVPLTVHGAMSPRLAWGLREHLQLHRAWWPRNTKPVELVLPRLETPAASPRAVGCSFSGGVDSLFTAFRHLPRNEAFPEYRITHLIVVNGFDFDQHTDDPSWFATLRRIYGPLAEKEGLQLCEVRTNLFGLMALGAPVDWFQWLGALIAIPALALGDGLARHYVGATEGYAKLEAFGSSPLSDPWFSTESLHIIHDGAEARRIEKLATIAEWPETWDRLRVCRDHAWRNVDVARVRIENCAACDKCVRTMIALRLIDRLDRFTTFRRPLTLPSILNARLGPTSLFYLRENLRIAWHKRHYDLAAALLASWAMQSMRALMARVVH